MAQTKPSLLLYVATMMGAGVASAADDEGWVDRLNLEAHGFVSFGYLESERNNWLGSTLPGTGQFWEAAANVIMRPADRVRIGAQIFARDLVKYDNGRVDLDWAYADYRLADALGVQVGRVKLPLALYNESLDIDAARTQVFLAPSVYALRSRDLFISTDGGKLYGSVNLGVVGECEYAAFIGAKQIDSDAGFATYMGELGLGPDIDDISADLLGGVMLHWHTPIPNLGLRFSLADLHGFEVKGSDSVNGVTTYTKVNNYYEYWISLLYELSDVTIAAEYTRVHGRGETEIAPYGLIIPIIDNTEGAYIGVTWHAREWFETYAGIEFAWGNAYDRTDLYCYTGVLAANLMPLPNWSLKAEVRGSRGTLGITAADNPQGVDDRWGVLALKTTVDF